MKDNHLFRYNDPKIADDHKNQGELFECENIRFNRYAMSGLKVLDICVGMVAPRSRIRYPTLLNALRYLFQMTFKITAPSGNPSKCSI